MTERKGGTTVQTPAADPVGRTGQIRVMIADDEEAVRDALASLIAEDPEMSVVGTGGDAEQAIAIAGGNIRTSRSWMSACPEAEGPAPRARSDA